MESITEFFNGILDILETPLVIAGLGTVTIGSVIIGVLRVVFGTKKSEIKAFNDNLQSQSSKIDNCITKEQYNSLIAYNEKLQGVLVKVVEQVKNQDVKEQLVSELDAIEKPEQLNLVSVVENVSKKINTKKRF